MAEINLKKLSAGVSEIEVFFNEETEGFADATIPLNVNLTDGTTTIVPTSVALTGNDLDITIVPSGVFFKTIEPSQYTSYRTGDEGWRVQNSFYNYTPPANPKAIAELDYTQTNFCDILKNPLVVNGVSSTNRFVNVAGNIAGGAGDNSITIDKLTGMAYLQTGLNKLSWNAAIDDALTYSITVNSITFSDWYLTSEQEFQSIKRDFVGFNLFQVISNLANIVDGPANFYSATTSPLLTTSYFEIVRGSFNYRTTAKTTAQTAVYITNVRNLITAP